MSFSMDTSSEIQATLFKTAEAICEITDPGLEGFAKFGKTFDIFQFLMREPDWSMGVSVPDLATEYQTFFADQFDPQLW